ncbi:uncharacterized protein F5Z01DRAFT_548976, partial [Emericellopsis atlantica]
REHDISLFFSLGSLFHLLQWCDLLNHLGRDAQRNAPGRNILGYDGPRANGAALANRHPRQDDHLRANPAIVPNRNRLGKLDILPTTLDFRLVRGGNEGHIRSHGHAVANRHNRAVQDGQVEIGIEALAEADVAPIINGEGRLDQDFVVINVADDLLQQEEALCGDLIKGLDSGVVVVVVHGPSPRLEANSLELRHECVIACQRSSCRTPRPWAHG